MKELYLLHRIRLSFGTILVLVFLMPFQNNVSAQVYATPELKLEAERTVAAKGQDQSMEIPVVDEQTDHAGNSNVKNIEVSTRGRSVYKLRAITVVNVNQAYTKDELEGFQAEADRTFLKRKTFVDLKKGFWYAQSNLDGRPSTISNIQRSGDLIDLIDVPGNFDHMYRIVNRSSRKLILELQPQDSWADLVYHFEFTK